MGRHRSRLEIAADILYVVSNNDVKKTRIMDRARLSWNLSTRYLNELVEAGLVSLDGSDCYVLTPKGKMFLNRFSEYYKRREMVERELKDVGREREKLENVCFNRNRWVKGGS